MKIRITCLADLDADRILKSRGLGPDRQAEKFLASEVKRLSDPYVPFRQGTLKNTAQIVDDGAGTALVYNTPYAHYQWHGEVMGPNVLTDEGWRSMAKKGAKKYTGRPLTYSGGGLRGPRWTERMMADRHDDVVRSLANYVGGKPK